MLEIYTNTNLGRTMFSTEDHENTTLTLQCFQALELSFNSEYNYVTDTTLYIMFGLRNSGMCIIYMVQKKVAPLEG